MSGSKIEPKVAKPGAAGAEVEPMWAKSLRESVENLGTHMSQVVQVLKSPPQQRAAAPQSNLPRQDDDKDDVIDPNVLETLPRAQFMDLITKRITKAMQKDIVAPLNEELHSLKNGLSSTQVEKMIEQAQAKHPDFLEFQDEMLQLAKTHKTLTPLQLYNLAKADAPAEKLEKVAEKHKPADDGAKKPAAFSFGGLMPSNGGDGAENRRMAPNDAADDAWAKVVAEMGGQPAFTE